MGLGLDNLIATTLALATVTVVFAALVTLGLAPAEATLLVLN